MQLWTVLKGIPLLGVMHDDGENRFPPCRANRLNPFEIMLVGYRRSPTYWISRTTGFQYSELSRIAMRLFISPRYTKLLVNVSFSFPLGNRVLDNRR